MNAFELSHKIIKRETRNATTTNTIEMGNKETNIKARGIYNAKHSNSY